MVGMYCLAKAALCFFLMLLLRSEEVFAVNPDVKKSATTNPCPHLHVSGMVLFQFFDKKGKSKQCCGCLRDQYVAVPCSNEHISTCMPCLSGTELNANVHGNGMEACTQIPITSPPAVILDNQKNHHKQTSEIPNTDLNTTPPTQTQQPDALPPEKDKTKIVVDWVTIIFIVAVALAVLVTFVVIKWKDRFCLNQNGVAADKAPERVEGSREDIETSFSLKPDEAKPPNQVGCASFNTQDETTPALSKSKAPKPTKEKLSTKAAEEESEQCESLLATTHDEPASKLNAIGDGDYSALIREPDPPERLSVSNSHDLAGDGPTAERQMPLQIEQRDGASLDIPGHSNMIDMEHGGAGNPGPPIQRGSAQLQMVQNTNQNIREREIKRLERAENDVLHSKTTPVFHYDVVRLLSHFQVPENTKERLANEYNNDRNPLLYLYNAMKEVRKNSDNVTVEILIEYWRENGLTEMARYVADKMGINIA